MASHPLARLTVGRFAAGLCAALYVLGWVGLLEQFFGGPTAATATVFVVTLGTFGLGAVVFGATVAESRGDKARVVLQLLAAVTAAVSVPLIAIASWLYFRIDTGDFGTGGFGIGGLVVTRLVVAAVLGGPSFLLAGALVAPGRSTISQRALGFQFAATIAGAACGILVASFWLWPLLGLRQTIWLAAAVQILFVLWLRSRASFSEASSDAETSASKPEGRVSKWILWTFAGLGFVSAWQVLVWTRMLTPLVDPATDALALVFLMSFLGIGTGALASAWLPKISGSANVHLSVICGAAAVLVAIPYALGDRVAFWQLELLAVAHQSAADGSVESGRWPNLLLATAVVVPAAATAGALLALGARLRGALIACALGAIGGAIGGSLWLIPELSATGSWRLTPVLLAALAFLGLVRRFGATQAPAVHASGNSSEPRRYLPAVPVVLLALAGVALAATPGPTDFWRQGGGGAGRQRPPATTNQRTDAIHQVRASVVWQRDGRQSGVAMRDGNGLASVIDGRFERGARTDATTAILSGLIAAALHPEPTSSLVLDFGEGTTAGWLAQVDGMEHIDAVEVEPLMLQLSAEWAPINWGAPDLRNIELHLDDPRAFLLAADRSYDLILADLTNRHRSGGPSLSTREIYESIASHLRPGGLFAIQIRGAEVDSEQVRTTYVTLLEVFSSVETWQLDTESLLLVASRDEMVHDPVLLRKRVEKEPLRSALLHCWGVRGLEGLYTGYLATPEVARAIAANPLVESRTDDRSSFDLGFSRRFGTEPPRPFQLSELTELALQLGEQRPKLVFGVDWVRVDELREARFVALGALFVVDRASEEDTGKDTAGARSRARQAYVRGGLDEAYRQWFGSFETTEPEAEATPAEKPQVGDELAPSDLLLAAEAAADRGDDRALSLAERLRELRIAADDAVLGQYWLRRENPERAARHLRAAFDWYQRDPWFPRATASRALRSAIAAANVREAERQPLIDSLAQPFALALLDQERATVRLALTLRSPDPTQCVDALQYFEPFVPWTEPFLVERVGCYQRAANSKLHEAERDLTEFRSRG